MKILKHICLQDNKNIRYGVSLKHGSFPDHIFDGLDFYEEAESHDGKLLVVLKFKRPIRKKTVENWVQCFQEMSSDKLFISNDEQKFVTVLSHRETDDEAPFNIISLEKARKSKGRHSTYKKTFTECNEETQVKKNEDIRVLLDKIDLISDQISSLSDEIDSQRVDINNMKKQILENNQKMSSYQNIVSKCHFEFPSLRSIVCELKCLVEDSLNEENIKSLFEARFKDKEKRMIHTIDKVVMLDETVKATNMVNAELVRRVAELEKIASISQTCKQSIKSVLKQESPSDFEEDASCRKLARHV